MQGDSSQNKQIIQVRFAETGYPQDFNKITSLQNLMQAILKTYKIQIPYQIIISRRGNILNNKSNLDNENSFQQTLTQDYSTSKKQIPYVYLFNHKQLMKIIDNQNYLQQAQIQSKNALQKHYQTCKGLRHRVFQLKTLEEKFTKQKINKVCQYNPMLPQMANQWLQSTQNFLNIQTTIKENQNFIDEYIDRWENQRKGLQLLTKNLISYCKDTQTNISKIKDIHKTFGATFNQIKDENLQMNIQKNQNLATNVKNIEKKNSEIRLKINQIEHKFKSTCDKIKLFKNRIAQTHIQLQKKIKQIDENKHKNRKHLTQILTQMKYNYVTLTQGFKQLIQNGDDSKILIMQAERKNIQANNIKFIKLGEQYQNRSQELFIQIYKMSKSHQQMVRSQYKKYHQFHIGLQDFNKSPCEEIQIQIFQMYKLFNQFQQYIKLNAQKLTQNSKKSKLIKQCEQAQMKRRQHFNMKLLGIQDQVREILKQQQNKRNKFIIQIFQLQQQYHHPQLTNPQVPCFILNYDQTTDRQLAIQANGSKGKINIKNSSVLQQNINYNMNLQFYKSNSGLDRVLQQLQFLKNYQISLKKDDCSQQSKIKNIQILLEKSADIFHHIYTQKLKIVQKQYELKQSNLQKRIKILDSQNKYLRQEKIKYQQIKNINIEDTKQLQKTIQMLQQKINSLIGEKAHIQNKYNNIYEQNEKKLKQYQIIIEDNKKQISKLKNQKRDIEDKISKQVNGTLQTLLGELERSAKKIKQLQNINQEYKNVMGDQQVRIITLQTQIKKSKQNGNDVMSNSLRLKESFYGQHLKLAQKYKSQQQIQINQNDNLAEKQQKIQQQLQQIQLLQPRISKKQSKTITNEQIKQIQREITKLQKQIQQLKQQNEQLRTENMSLNQQILKIAMKDTQDQQIQTQDYEQQKQQQVNQNRNAQNQSSNGMTTQTLSQHIKIYDNPIIGQLRLFMPFSNGVYILVKTNKIYGEPTTTQYASSTINRNLLLQQTQMVQINSLQQNSWPYLIDMNCLTNKARQLLTQCTLIVTLRVTKILQGNQRFYVQGDIISAIGFQDQDMVIKDYGPLLKN